MTQMKQNKIKQWNCNACTFINDVTTNKCAICNTVKHEQNNLNQFNESNDYYDRYNEYLYYDQDLEYNQYDDVECDSLNKTFTKITLSTHKKKKRKKKTKQHSKKINKNVSNKSIKHPSKTSAVWPSYIPSSKESLKTVYDVDMPSNVKLETSDNITKATDENEWVSNIYYKQYAENMGLSIRWSKKQEYIFPHYRPIEGNVATQKRINKAANVVCLLLKHEQRKIIQTFKRFIDENILETEEYFGKRRNTLLKVDIDGAIQRVKTAEIQEGDMETFGEADECNIYITKGNISDEDLIGTLLHEALHFVSTVNGREMSENDEHVVIKKLGDDEC